MHRSSETTNFSTLNMLLLVALLIGGVSHIHTSRTLSRTAKELQTLRNGTGQLTMGDVDHFHVIALPLTEGLEWNWRIYIPADRKYRLCWAVGGDIPPTGFPAAFAPEDFDDLLFAETPESSFILSARLHNDSVIANHATSEHASEEPPADRWKLTLHQPLHSMSIPIAFHNDIDWLVRDLRYGPTLAGHSETQTAAPGESIVLLRVRRFKDAMAGAYSIDSEPCDGFLVWLDPE